MTKEFRQMAEDIYLLETPAGGVWSGIVLVEGEQKVLIDSGECAAHIDNLLVPALQKMGYGLEEITWLCNTHCHGDHVGGHRRIVETGNIKVAAFEKSVSRLKEPLSYSKQIRKRFPGYSPPAPTVLDGVETNLVLKDGDTLAGRLQVVASPGHDDDSICFYDLKTKTLISGDSLQGNGTCTQGTALYMNLEAYRTTLERLKGMEISNIVSAHPYLLSGADAHGKEVSKRYLEKCREVTDIYEEYIQRIWTGGEREPAKIAKGLIQYMGNKKPDWLFLPLYTVHAHLKEMQRREKTEREIKGEDYEQKYFGDRSLQRNRGSHCAGLWRAGR